MRHLRAVYSLMPKAVVTCVVSLMSSHEEILPQPGVAGEFVFLLNKAGWEKVI